MSHILMVHVASDDDARDNLDLGLSSGRWAFPISVRSRHVPSIEIGDFVFFGVGGKPRNGGGFDRWQERSLVEAHLVCVTRPPFENTEPFWPDEVRDGVLRWNPTIEFEYRTALGSVPLAAGAALSLHATNTLYRSGVSHRVERIPIADVLVAGSEVPLSETLVKPRARGLRRRQSPSRLVAIEARRSRRMRVKARAALHADPIESLLLHDYADHLIAGGDVLRRLAIPVPGGMIYSDLVNLTREALVEAKGRTTREHVRTAIGQILDYGRHWRAARSAILVPERPDEDLLALLASVEIDAIWREGDAFADTAGGALS